MSATAPRITLGDFLLERRIASGGMGEVWLATHRTRKLPAAVKLLGGALGPEAAGALVAFRQEVRAVAALDHPGIVMVFDQGTVGPEAADASEGRLSVGTPWLAMEYAGGGNLAPLSGHLGWTALRRLLLQLLDALAHAHARSVIHRDLKPANVIIATGSDLRPGPKLTDFGIAHLLAATDGPQDGLNPVMGSPAYMAPEQIEAAWRDFGPWTDLYSLGCLTWTLTTGLPPFVRADAAATSAAHLVDELPALDPAQPLPPGFEGWLRRLLVREPAGRFPSAPDAARALRALGSNPVQERPTPPRTWRAATPEAGSVHLPGGGLGLWGLRTIPMVNRVGQRDVIWSALRDVARRRRPRTVVIEGPPGTGKSRLARWVAERAGELGVARQALGTHDPIGGPGHGLVPTVARLLRCDDLDREQTLARVSAWLRDHGGADRREARALTRLLGPTAGETTQDGALPGLRGEGAQRQALIARTLARAAGDRPLVLVLEDVQWGPGTLAFVEFVRSAAAPRDLPLLLILTVREEELVDRPALAGRLALLSTAKDAQRLRVGPLAPRDHAALVRSLVDMEEPLVRRVARRTEGNPLFAVLLVGDWVRRGALRPGPNGLQLRSGEEERLPRDVRQLGTSLLAEALGPLAERNLPGLELVAALGGRVDEEELSEACARAGTRHPGELLERLAVRRLAVRERGGWALPQTMLREVLSASARRAGRWELLNLACAEALAGLNPQLTGRLRARIGRHLTEAGELDQALDHLLAGARERVQLDDYAEADSLLGDAKAALVPPGRDGDSVRDRRWGETLALRAMLHTRQDEYDAALGYAARAETLARRFDWPRVAADSFVVQGHVARRRGDYARAEDLLSHAQLRYREVDDERGLADCWHGLAMVALRQGRYERARELTMQVLERAGLARDQAGEVPARATLAELDRLTGQTEEARAGLRLAIGAAREAGSLWYLGFLLNSLGEMERMAGNHAVARDHYQDAVDAFVSAGSRQAVVPRFNAAYVELALGRNERARELLSAALAEVKALGWKTIEAALHVALLACAAAMGDWEAWATHRDASFPILRVSGSADPDVAMHARRAGKLALQAGRPALAREAWELARDVHFQAGDEAAAEQFAELVESLS
jgi:eukaryotic-like serine/threonine-protein kinase